ncbi:hypothetical protein BDZ91DRAFT_802270 [Kalaharituber pfeilii]|nr:hypothetical protein BDZ91DRAFT_802270 [Kalaharituber pfeilii]
MLSSSQPVVQINVVSIEPRKYVDQMLAKAQTPKQRTQLLLENQIKFGEFGQEVNELIAYAQEKIEKEQSWIALGMDQKVMWDQIQYTSVIRPAINQHNQSDQRKRRFLATIEAMWTSDWRNRLDPEGLMLPSKESEHLVALRRLALEKNSTPEAIGRLVSETIAKRLANRSTSKRSVRVITMSDVLAVEKIVKEMPQLINQCIIENNEDEEGNGEKIATEIPRTTNKHTIEDDEDEEGDGRIPSIEPKEDNSDDDDNNDSDGTDSTDNTGSNNTAEDDNGGDTIEPIEA